MQTVSNISIFDVKLVRESTKAYNIPTTGITSPEKAYDAVQTIFSLSDKTKEHLVMLSLNTSMECIGAHVIHIGTVDRSIVHPREILQHAILNNATAMMIFHNHPSGNTNPSSEDIKMTQMLIQACDLMGIPLLDHIIVGPDSYTSLKQEGHFL